MNHLFIQSNFTVMIQIIRISCSQHGLRFLLLTNLCLTPLYQQKRTVCYFHYLRIPASFQFTLVSAFTTHCQAIEAAELFCSYFQAPVLSSIIVAMCPFWYRYAQSISRTNTQQCQPVTRFHLQDSLVTQSISADQLWCYCYIN